MVYNTLTRQKEQFETLEPGIVKMYVCGVTVYSDSHVGHALMAITFDVIRRYLEWTGYQVEHAQNFTDVDDKIINRARDLGIEPIELSDRMIETWHEESEALNVLPATVYPRASEEIPDMIEMIAGLIEDDYAYVVEGGDVNYDVTKFDGYGKLSHQNLDELLAGARVEVDKRKRQAMDFVLWKASKPGEPQWDSPWGPGRPGWHIECSVMARRHLGNTIDIHGGGTDLIFPHHENEIAQTEAFEDCRPFSRYWMHNALLELGGEKMSKSIGNLVDTAEILENGDASNFRLMVLQTHYRHPLTFTEEGLESARRGYDRLITSIRGFNLTDYDQNGAEGKQEVERAEAAFRSAMNDDFNTPVAVSVLFDLARRANSNDGETRNRMQAKLLELGDVLGLPLRRDAETSVDGKADPFVDLLLELRKLLRADQQWDLSDVIRDRLGELGVTVEDTAGDSSWRWSRR